MNKKTGLGKGLDALFAPTPEEEKMHDNDILRNVKVNDIEPNRDQPRRNFDQESLENLAESIKEYGLIQPIVVTEKNGYYQIVAGERRWRASKIAGLDEIPVIVREDDAKKNSEISLIENIQRKDLNPYEKAIAVKNLMDTYQLTQSEVAQKLGIGRSSVANIIRILNLEPRVLEFAKQGKINESNCKVLLSITDPEKQYHVAMDMLKNDIKTDELTKMSKRVTKKGLTTEQMKKNMVFYRDIESKFQNFFGTKVKMQPGKRTGKIVIEYSSNDELERIINIVKGNEA